MSLARLLPRRLLGVAVAGLFVVGLPAQQSAADLDTAVALDQAIIAAATKDSEIMKNLGYLSDYIGPRLTGSDSLKRANEWAAEVMKSYGLENVHQEGWNIPVGWERGTASARIVEPNNGRSLLIASRGWSPGTKGKTVGDVVIFEARSSKDFDKYRGKLKNAIILRGKPAEVRPAWDLSAAPTRSRERAAAAEKARLEQSSKKNDQPADKGAAPSKPPTGEGAGRPGRGAAQPLDFTRNREFAREADDFLRSEGAAILFQDSAKPQGLLVTTGNWRGTDRVTGPEPLPAAYIAHEHYELLYRLASRAGDAKTRVEVEMTNTFTPGPITCYNTVGEIKGAKKPEEFVIVGAHIDSWDLATGTTDNGTGTCIVLETARLLKTLGVKPDRTIRFVLFSGEEQGLHGSRVYTEQHKDEMAKTSMCLVHDTGTGKVQGIALSGFEAVKPILEKELTSLKPLGVTNISIGGLNAGGSDHASFARIGVPGFAVIQDMSEYRFTHHTQTDTLDKVHPENLIQGAQVLAVSAVRVANLPNLLPRDRVEPPRRGGRGGAPQKGGDEKKDAAKKAPIGVSQ
jgi:carboxypeptidase Q